MRLTLAIALASILFISCFKKDDIGCDFKDQLVYYSEDYKESCAQFFGHDASELEALWIVFFDEDGYKLSGKVNGEVVYELGKVDKADASMSLIADEGLIHECTFLEIDKEFYMDIECSDRADQPITFIYKCVKDKKGKE